MQKREHDAHAATVREPSYVKPWFIAAKNALQNVAQQRGLVLDFCCGNGEFSEIIKEELNYEAVCLDYAGPHLEMVGNIGFETIDCDVEDRQRCNVISAKNANRFDIVVMNACIEHFFLPDEVLAFVYKMLKPNGHLIVTTPNMEHLSLRLYSMFCGNIPAEMGHHTYFFNARRLKQLLSLSAFDIGTIDFFGETGWYFDRAVAYPKSFAKQCLLKLLWKLGKSFGGEGLNRSGLIAVAQKNSNAKPLALDPAVRERLYAEMRHDEQIETIRRLSAFDQDGMFAEHPGLRNFLKKNQFFEYNGKKDGNRE